LPRTKRQRHIGYILVPIVDDNGKTLILPSIWKCWRPVADTDPEYIYATVWTSKAAANKARRRIYGATYKAMKIYRLRLENV
jgi:hypothetical protein